MTKTRAISFALAAVALAWCSIATTAQAPVNSPYPIVAGQAYKFEKVADGVFYATSTGAMATGSNIPVIVNDRTC